jgi:hypothetical protein
MRSGCRRHDTNGDAAGANDSKVRANTDEVGEARAVAGKVRA